MPLDSGERTGVIRHRHTPMITTMGKLLNTRWNFEHFSLKRNSRFSF